MTAGGDGGFSVRTADLSLAADFLLARAVDLTGELAMLETVVDKLRELTSGAASDAAVDVGDRLVHGLSVQVRALRESASTARELGQLYAEADVQVARLFGD